MAIKGLTDNVVPLETKAGRNIRLGWLQKGARESFGKSIKLRDYEHFVFKPIENGERGKLMEQAFRDAYGEKPRFIPDVRIPESIAGNFHIESAAWLMAYKHTERGSIMLARSDGQWVKQARSESNGRRVEFYQDEELGFAAVTQMDGKGNPCFVYKGKLYQWVKEMQIDLILPDFNRRLYANRIAGHGVVTLITHSSWDISNLISEYRNILDTIASLFANPLENGHYERVLNNIPLRNIPLRLYRSTDKISTPDYRENADPSDRLLSTRDLVHWQLSPEFSASAQDALDKRTQQTLALVANMPLLQAGRATVEDINADLFGDSPRKPQLQSVVTVPPEPEYEDDDVDLLQDILDDDETETVEGEIETPVIPGDFGTVKPGKETPNLSDGEWEQSAREAENVDQLAFRLFQRKDFKVAFNDAGEVRKACFDMFGPYQPENTPAVVDGLKRYVISTMDGAKKQAAVRAAQLAFRGA